MEVMLYINKYLQVFDSFVNLIKIFDCPSHSVTCLYSYHCIQVSRYQKPKKNKSLWIFTALGEQLLA